MYHVNWEILEGWIEVQMIFVCFLRGTNRYGIYILLVRIPSMKYIMNIQPSFVFVNIYIILQENQSYVFGVAQDYNGNVACKCNNIQINNAKTCELQIKRTFKKTINNI